MIKPLLSKLNFALGRNPKILKSVDWRNYVPEPFKAVLLISADFELAWAWRYSKKKQVNIENFALTKASTERGNIPRIIELCETYNIPITWYTVGHLFIDGCKRENGRAHNELLRPGKFENKWWRFNGADWYEHDPCSDYLREPLWYAPDLIQLILQSKVNHEIGCHTYSHIDCTHAHCSPELFQSELDEFKKVASNFNLINLKSFVHPGHMIGHIDILMKNGFTNFRTDYGSVLSYPRRHFKGLWELKNTTDFNLRKEWSIEYHIYRYKRIIERAMKTNTVCILWFHPSFNPIFVKSVFPEIFRFLNSLKNDLLITTSGRYCDWLNEHNVNI